MPVTILHRSLRPAGHTIALCRDDYGLFCVRVEAWRAVRATAIAIARRRGYEHSAAGVAVAAQERFREMRNTIYDAMSARGALKAICPELTDETTPGERRGFLA